MPGDLSPAQMLAAMRYLEPSDDSRSTFQYLNLGYLVASMVTERVSGQSWTEFTRARLADKLHMNVTFTVEDLAVAWVSRNLTRCSCSPESSSAITVAM
jgi:CubicO group peptidase (beta-lactamase class C family)